MAPSKSNSFLASVANPGLMRMFYRSIALKSDAARYDVAMRTIAGVTSMRLENPQELKAALAILNQQFTHLKLHRSKLVTFVLSDYTFTSALKEACPNQAAAEALIREWRANPNAVFKLRGAYALSWRLAESVRADAATAKHRAGVPRVLQNRQRGSYQATLLRPRLDGYRADNSRNRWDSGSSCF